MKLVTLIAVGSIAALSLAGCETTTATAPVAKPASGNELTQEMANQQMIAFAVPRAIAESYARECAKDGISLREPSRWTVIDTFRRQMMDKGYTVRMLDVAESNMDRHQDSLTRAAIKGLLAKGAKRGDVASFCALGKREIASGTTVGKQLKLG